MFNKRQFQEFEHAVMMKILSGNDPTLGVLRKQYWNMKTKKWEFTGVGFYIDFDKAEDALVIEGKTSFEIGDVVADINNERNAVGFVLFIRDGMLDMLEAHTYGNKKWPKRIENVELRFIDGDKRDMTKLRLLWSH